MRSKRLVPLVPGWRRVSRSTRTSCGSGGSRFCTTIVITAAMRTTGRADAPVNNVRPGIEVGPKNLTPNPFPSGKGSQIDCSSRFRCEKENQIVGSNPFASGKTPLHSSPPSQYGKGLGVRSRKVHIFLPFPLGKGSGVRFSGATLLLISTILLAAAAGCAQVHEKMFTLDCAVGRAPLAGELAPGTAMALDVSSSPIPLLFPPHRAIARCDSAGVVTMNIETPVDTGLSQLSTPLSTAASHITYAP